ncbi:ead/Ea22-like family protein [Escherichia coli]
MSNINYQALRMAAEKATKGSYIVGHTSVNQHGNLTGVFVCQKWKGEPGGVIAECHVNCLVETDAQAYANAEFIAAFNPEVAMVLLDERKVKNRLIVELTMWIKRLSRALKYANSLSSLPDQAMAHLNQNVLISVNFDSDLVEPLICSARYTGSTFRRGEATIKPGNGIEQAAHWMPLPEPPQEVN